MSYCTVAMVRLAIAPSLSDPTDPPATPTNTAADLSNDQIQDAIDEADAMIDGYIGRFYAVPVANVLDTDGVTMVVPHPLDYWSRNLAAYAAALTQRASLDVTDQAPIVRRYNATMDALKAVAAGTLQLQLPRNVSDNAATGASAPYNPYVGDLWQPGDFDLRPANFNPVYGPMPVWYDAWWNRG